MTTPSAVVKNTFRVTSADGGALSEERLRALRKAVVTCASKSYSTLKSVAASSKVRTLLVVCTRGARSVRSLTPAALAVLCV